MTCSKCKIRPTRAPNRYCTECKREYNRQYEVVHRAERTKAHREYRRVRRLQILEHYGGKCACCGETESKFLSLDHINNDAANDRKMYGRASWQVAIQKGMPNTFQVLCHNCNLAKGFYKVCPHKEQLLAN